MTACKEKGSREKRIIFFMVKFQVANSSRCRVKFPFFLPCNRTRIAQPTAGRKERMTSQQARWEKSEEERWKKKIGIERQLSLLRLALLLGVGKSLDFSLKIELLQVEI